MKRGYFGYRIRDNGRMAPIHAAASRTTFCGMKTIGMKTRGVESEPVSCQACLAVLARKQQNDPEKKVIVLSRARDGVHKFVAQFPDGALVRFGRKGYSDYTMHESEPRMRLYLARHRARENWTKSGIKTPGFWSRWLLWYSPSLAQAVKRVERLTRHRIRIVF